MRTPKLHRLEKLIDWYDRKDNNLMCPPLRGGREAGLDSTPLDSNAWLAGMSDADSNFNIILTNGSNGSCRIQTHWSIEYAQKTYHGYDQLYWGSRISSYLDTTLYSRSREREGKIYSSFTVMAHSNKSTRRIIEYFNRYPLLSAKHLDYKDWERVVDMATQRGSDLGRAGKGTLEYTNMLKQVANIKAGMNNKRRIFNWEHLDSITSQMWETKD